MSLYAKDSSLARKLESLVKRRGVLSKLEFLDIYAIKKEYLLYYKMSAMQNDLQMTKDLTTLVGKNQKEQGTQEMLNDTYFYTLQKINLLTQKCSSKKDKCVIVDIVKKEDANAIG